MSNFYLSSDALPATQRILLRRAIGTGAALVGASLCYGRFVLRENWLEAAGLSLVLFLVTAFSYRRNLQQQQAAIASFRLEVEPTHITRFQQNLPTLQLLPAEITRITQNYQGVLTIATTDSYRVIQVPAQVSDREKLLQALAAFAPLTIQARKTLLEKAFPFISIAMLLLMSTFYVVSNVIISTITGVLILGILAWSGWHIWRNPNLPPQARRARWFIPIVFLSILAGIIARLQQ